MTEGIDEFAAAHGYRKRNLPMAERIPADLLEVVVAAWRDGHHPGTLCKWLEVRHGVTVGRSTMERYLKELP